MWRLTPSPKNCLSFRGLFEDFSSRGVILACIREEYAAGHIQRSPAEFRLRVYVCAALDQVLHDAGLTGNNRRMQRGAAAPARIALNLVGQLREVEGVIKEEVLRIAFHLVIAEVGVGIDVVAELDRELHGFDALNFAAPGERAGRFTFPIIQS